MASSYCSSSSIAEVDSGYRKALVVFLLGLMGIGSVMILESPRTLQDVYLKEMKIKLAQFELHYYLLFWSNALTWTTGFIIDRYLDLRLATVVFMTTSCIGNTLYAIGAVTRVFTVMLFGWLITGLGVEASIICVCCYIFRWFSNNFPNTIFGIIKTVMLLGRCLIFRMSDGLMTRLKKSFKISTAFSITISLEMSLIVIPLICAVFLALISKRKLSKERDYQNNIKIAHIIKFPLSYWILSISVNIFFSSCYIFLRLNVLSSKYGLNQEVTETLINGFILLACFMGPIIGLVVDCNGRNLTFITLAFIGGAIAHFAFAYTVIAPFFPMTLLSISFSLVVGSYWSLYSLILKKNEITAALALDCAIFMLCFAIGHTAAPRLTVYNKNAPQIYLLASMIFAIVGSCMLWGLDCHGNIFNQPKSKRERRNRRTYERKNENQDVKKKFIIRTPPPKFIKSERHLAVVSSRKNEPAPTYLKLKKMEAESNMYKHMRVKRHSERMLERKRSKSFEDLYILSSQV